MKLLHCADLHLDAPFAGQPEPQAAFLKNELLAMPEKIARLCLAEKCDLMLLSGDIFDGPYTRRSLDALTAALALVQVPVFIAPGNHDFCGGASPWLSEVFPENVHIFTRAVMDSVSLPELDCRVYGAGFVSMDCPPLLEGFTARQTERYAIGVLHGDPTRGDSPYCPVSTAQIRGSGLQYLALGHIHMAGSVQAGGTLCAWPGCPMGRGFDETGEKGVYLVDIGQTVTATFVPMDGPVFYDLETPAGADPVLALERVLPSSGSRDFYRITLTGEAEQPDLPRLEAEFARIPNLFLRDATLPPVDPWAEAGSDSLAGVYFRILQNALEGRDAETQKRITLAAKLSRQILDGQEVTLP